MQDPLEITVNRRRFDRNAGVHAAMTAEAIATLVGVPVRNAVVEREVGPGAYERLAPGDEISVKTGMHFLVTREFVMGG